MNWAVLVGGALALAALVAALYWLLVIAEGVYLGRRVVIWLYDFYASRYDLIKQFDEKDEAWFLGEPLAKALFDISAPLVLDVATGTARLPLALFRQPTFDGRVVGLDLSRRMLGYAAGNVGVYREHLTLLWQDATHLPFLDGVFDAVSCIEALEFLPDAEATLTEMARVLRPGGLLLTSNRTGPLTRWLVGRTMSREAFGALLESLALTQVSVSAWQVEYDIAWARKPGQATTTAPHTLPSLLCCPRCTWNPLTRQDSAFYCTQCASHYPIADDGVIEMGW